MGKMLEILQRINQAGEFPNLRDYRREDGSYNSEEFFKAAHRTFYTRIAVGFPILLALFFGTIPIRTKIYESLRKNDLQSEAQVINPWDNIPYKINKSSLENLTFQ